MEMEERNVGNSAEDEDYNNDSNNPGEIIDRNHILWTHANKWF